jgi:hypothetical protein
METIVLNRSDVKPAIYSVAGMVGMYLSGVNNRDGRNVVGEISGFETALFFVSMIVFIINMIRIFHNHGKL